MILLDNTIVNVAQPAIQGLYLIGLAIFTVFSAACGLARTDTELIIHRALQGAGAAIMAPLLLVAAVIAFTALGGRAAGAVRS